MKKFIITMLLVVSTAAMLFAGDPNWKGDPARKRYEVVKADAAVVIETTAVQKELEYNHIGKCYLVELDEDDIELFEKATADLRGLPCIAGSYDNETKQWCNIRIRDGEVLLRVTDNLFPNELPFKVSVYKVVVTGE